MENDWRSVLLDAVKKVSNFVFADYSLVLNSGNKSLPSSSGPLYQNEVKCSAFEMEMIFHSHSNKTHFHKKGCALGLILKVRVFGTRKWPIRQFKVAWETGSRWMSKCIVGLFWAANLRPC